MAHATHEIVYVIQDMDFNLIFYGTDFEEARGWVKTLREQGEYTFKQVLATAGALAEDREAELIASQECDPYNANLFSFHSHGLNGKRLTKLAE